MLTSDQNTVVE